MRVAYRDLVPISRLFSTWLPISERNQRHLANFIQKQDIPLDLCPDHENFKRTEGDTSSEDYNCLAESCRRHFTKKNLPAVTSMQSILLLESIVCGSGWMAAAHILPISRTWKHSGGSLAASMALVWKCPMDMRIQRLSSFNIGPVNNQDRG